MRVLLPLDEMTTQEKVSTMEALWRDLSEQADYESPFWHKEVLEAREGSKSSDWNEAKQRIRQHRCK